MHCGFLRGYLLTPFMSAIRSTLTPIGDGLVTLLPEASISGDQQMGHPCRGHQWCPSNLIVALTEAERGLKLNISPWLFIAGGDQQRWTSNWSRMFIHQQLPSLISFWAPSESTPANAAEKHTLKPCMFASSLFAFLLLFLCPETQRDWLPPAMPSAFLLYLLGEHDTNLCDFTAVTNSSFELARIATWLIVRHAQKWLEDF